MHRRKASIMKNANKERFYEEIDRRGFESWITTKRDVDGKAIGVEVHSKDDSHHFKELSEAEQDKVLGWIKANVFPRQTPLYGHTSYGMKHVLQHRTNIYVTNNQFKEAMLLCGFYPVEVDVLNWNYSISKKSPIFKLQEDCRCGLRIPACVMEYPHAEWEFEHGAWQCSNCGFEGSHDNCWYDADWEPKLHQCPTCGAIMGDINAKFPLKTV